jgi:hypothetical protein
MLPVEESTSTGPRPRRSAARVFDYLLVIGIGVVCGMVLAIIAGLSIGWIKFQC